MMRRWSPYIVMAILGTLFCFMASQVTQASVVSGATVRDTVTTWSDPVQLNSESGNLPVAISDKNGVVHVFWGSAPGDASIVSAVFYCRFENGEWSQLIDIITAPNGAWVQVFQAVIDSDGWIHLILESGGAFYTTVHISGAESARNWTKPIQLSDSQTTPGLALDANDNLHLIYTGDPRRDPLVYHRLSSDRGDTWSAPDIVAFSQPGAYPINVRIAVDKQGTLHAIWCESIEIFPPSGVYYAQSNDEGQTWTEPLEIAAGGYSWGSIGIDGDNNAHLFWTGTGAWAGKYHTWSLDNGRTWAPIEKLWPRLAGFLGFADMTIDSDGTLYLVSGAGDTSGQSFGVSTPGEIIYTQWQFGGWSSPIHISAPISNGYYEQASPRITIALGNKAHVVWSAFDHRNGVSSVWHVSAVLNAPAMAVIPGVSVVEEMTSVPGATITPMPETTVTRDSLPLNASSISKITPQFILGISAGLVVVIFILGVGVNSTRNRQ